MPLEQAKVLIVDDEKDLLNLLKKRLTGIGFKVIATDNCLEAIELSHVEQPDIIILDVLMPEMDGPELAEKLKESSQTRNIPVIFLTGMFPKHKNKKQGREVAGSLLFDKLCDMESLVISIHKLLAERTQITT